MGVIEGAFLTSNFRANLGSTPERFLQLSLRDWLLSQNSFQEPLQRFHPGAQFFYLRGESLNIQLIHATFLQKLGLSGQKGRLATVNGEWA